MASASPRPTSSCCGKRSTAISQRSLSPGSTKPSRRRAKSGDFKPVIDDPIASRNRDAVQRLVFCTGKIYYDLVAAGEHPSNISLIRVEELAPWPREVGDLVDQYPNVDEVVWAQEEPKNMGGWT